MVPEGAPAAGVGVSFLPVTTTKTATAAPAASSSQSPGERSDGTPRWPPPAGAAASGGAAVSSVERPMRARVAARRSAGAAYAVGGLPVSVAIDAGGTVRAVHVGELDAPAL